MNGLVKEIQQWISPNRSKVYIISSSTHSGFNAAQGKLFCMQISRADVADLIYFMAIARHRSFSRAAIELGVSASALSHALKGLETRLGVRLLNRTTKSVTPTAAGEELVQSVLQPFDTIEGALESLNRYRNTPTGRIRINAAVEAANLLLAPVMPAFMDRYPDIEIDIVASNRMVDVTDAGFDAGIRYGGTVPEDMVARRLSADIRWVIAASPDYLERYGTPEHPDDLLHHRCISNRLGDDRVYRWELARDGETYQMTVPGSDESGISLYQASSATEYARSQIKSATSHHNQPQSIFACSTVTPFKEI